MLPVPAALLGAGEHYALEVAGDSMVDAGILDGDYALIRRTDVARDGENRRRAGSTRPKRRSNSSAAKAR